MNAQEMQARERLVAGLVTALRFALIPPLRRIWFEREVSSCNARVWLQAAPMPDLTRLLPWLAVSSRFFPRVCRSTASLQTPCGCRRQLLLRVCAALQQQHPPFSKRMQLRQLAAAQHAHKPLAAAAVCPLRRHPLVVTRSMQRAQQVVARSTPAVGTGAATCTVAASRTCCRWM